MNLIVLQLLFQTINKILFGSNFLVLASFDLNAESKATIELEDLNTAKSLYIQVGLLHLCANDQTFTIGNNFDITYELSANLKYSDKNTFYPVVTNCDCDCSFFILSNKFDFQVL